MILSDLKAFESECEKESLRFIQNDETRTVAWASFNELLELLYKFSCCYWGCHGKEHVFETICARVVNNLVVASRSMNWGYYDESLSLVRSVGESANLLNLFLVDNTQIRRWIDLNEKERLFHFKPVNVRILLEKRKWLIPFDQNLYQSLCEQSTHPSPHALTNAYNKPRQAVLGLVFQPNGFEKSFWLSCYALSVVAGPISKLGVFAETPSKEMLDLGLDLFKISIENCDLLEES